MKRKDVVATLLLGWLVLAGVQCSGDGSGDSRVWKCTGDGSGQYPLCNCALRELGEHSGTYVHDRCTGGTSYECCELYAEATRCACQGRVDFECGHSELSRRVPQCPPN
jgi:hypothetical protein